MYIIRFFFLLGVIFIFTVFFWNHSDSNASSVPFVSENSFMNDRPKCGTTEYMSDLYDQDPSYRQRMTELEKFAEEYIRRHYRSKPEGIVIIPTVVHVVWNLPVQNISDDQIYSQIDVLNEDFRRWNLDTVNTPAPFKPLGADCEIEFRLAARDPNGNPSIGITRTYTTVTQFVNNAVKFTSSGGRDAWDRDRYMNIWVCNLGGGLLGFAQFPGGPPSTDGIVVGYNYFGRIGTLSAPFNKGRTATHEVGHWLWLYHIWGDSYCGNDLISDTPVQQDENYGCPVFPHRPNSCNTSNPHGDMFMNYMDYTDDGCMNIFTHGQSARMYSALAGPRLPIQSSNGATPVSGVPVCAFRADSLSILYGQPVNFRDLSAGIPTSWSWSFPGGNPSLSNLQNPVVTYPLPGIYTVRLSVSNSHGTDSLTKTNYIRVRGPLMNPFLALQPPSNTRVGVSAGDTSKVNFIWQKSSSNPLVKYRWKIQKIGSPTIYSFQSNSNGSDSLISLTRSMLDSLAVVMGTTGDSVRCVWRAWSYNGLDSLQSTNSLIVTLVRGPIGIQVISNEIPDRYALYTNYPNPFNPSTRIKFDVSVTSEPVRISVFDITGREVSVILDEKLSPGKYEVLWNGEMFSSGIYFVRMYSGNFSETRRMILIK